MKKNTVVWNVVPGICGVLWIKKVCVNVRLDHVEEIEQQLRVFLSGLSVKRLAFSIQQVLHVVVCFYRYPIHRSRILTLYLDVP